MDQEGNPTDSPPERRLTLPERLAAAAAGIGEAITRTAGAAGAVISDGELRKRGAQVIADNASKGIRGIQYGIQSGASTINRGFRTVQQGPRQLQSVLQRLSQQIEEQRMRILLEEERDAPVDVQVGFQLYEDAPQELRSRLWMALLHHPELSVRFQAVLKETAPQNEGDGAGEPSETHAEEGKVPTNNQIGDAPESTAPAVEQLSDAGEQQIQGGAEASPRSPHGAAEEGGWEVVTDRGTQRYWQGRQLLAGGSFHRMEPWSSAREAYRQDLMAAMAALPWPVPVEPPPEGRYATLLQISIGQEETDDVIARDIHRTFPEHPQFSFEQGQQALFRVLKAYSLHDLEVGYCQGMAFVAGLLLFYVPEEPAFDIFCRLLAATGPNLRRHYLPGLHGLKMELCKFEWLLGKHLPNLRAHLEAHGAVPVLFASQWFLSAFSCPFPVSFACRLVDVMLMENSDAVLMRTALAVMAECEAELLMQETFEELLTYLKVEPMNWGPLKLRRVLNATVNSPVTDAELELAAKEASEQDHLLLTNVRREKGRSRGREAAEDGGGSGTVTAHDEEQPLEGGAGGEASGEVVPVSAGGVEDEGMAAVGEGNEDIESELAQHQAELDTAYLQMILDLDQMGFEDSEGTATEAYEQALTGREDGSGGLVERQPGEARE